MELMAVDAGGHRGVFFLAHGILVPDLTVADGAIYFGVDVLLVTEKYERWQLVDAYPRNLLACFFQSRQFLNLRTRGHHGLVTCHTRGNIRNMHLLAIGGYLMAVVALHPSRRDVEFVAERDWLHGRGYWRMKILRFAASGPVAGLHHLQLCL